jgi:hypothetical protein
VDLVQAEVNRTTGPRTTRLRDKRGNSREPNADSGNRGEVARPYVLEFTRTLAQSNSWQILTSLLLTNDSHDLTDPSTSPQRFYRARLNQ